MYVQIRFKMGILKTKDSLGSLKQFEPHLNQNQVACIGHLKQQI